MEVAYNYNLPKSSGTMMLVGDYGLGTTSRNSSMGSQPVNDIKALDLSGFFSGGGSGAINLHDPFSSNFSIKSWRG